LLLFLAMSWHMSLASLEAYVAFRDACLTATQKRNLVFRRMTQVFPGLFLGSYKAAENIARLKSHNIRSVLTIHQQQPPERIRSAYADANIQQCYLECPDVHIADVASHFGPSYDFICSRLQHGGVLVHCMAGRNRSPILVMHFLIRYLYEHDTRCRATFASASTSISSSSQRLWERVYVWVKRRRPLVDPPLNYIDQLKRAEQQILLQCTSCTMPQFDTLGPLACALYASSSCCLPLPVLRMVGAYIGLIEVARCGSGRQISLLHSPSVACAQDSGLVFLLHAFHDEIDVYHVGEECTSPIVRVGSKQLEAYPHVAASVANNIWWSEMKPHSRICKYNLNQTQEEWYNVGYVESIAVDFKKSYLHFVDTNHSVQVVTKDREPVVHYAACEDQHQLKAEYDDESKEIPRLVAVCGDSGDSFVLYGKILYGSTRLFADTHVRFWQAHDSHRGGSATEMWQTNTGPIRFIAGMSRRRLCIVSAAKRRRPYLSIFSHNGQFITGAKMPADVDLSCHIAVDAHDRVFVSSKQGELLVFSFFA